MVLFQRFAALIQKYVSFLTSQLELWRCCMYVFYFQKSPLKNGGETTIGREIPKNAFRSKMKTPKNHRFWSVSPFTNRLYPFLTHSLPQLSSPASLCMPSTSQTRFGPRIGAEDQEPLVAPGIQGHEHEGSRFLGSSSGGIQSSLRAKQKRLL